MMQQLQDQIVIEMIKSDRALEAELVSALTQLDQHKQSLLQVVTKMREQAIHIERQQQAFVEILLK